MEKMVIASAEKVGRALERDLNKAELQRVLGYVNIGLAIAHESGVSIGHFGCGDFIQLAQTVNEMLLHSITPPQAVEATDIPAGSALAV